MAISGDTIVVGAPGALNGDGAAYIFQRLADKWTQQGEPIKSVFRDGGFGTAVDIDVDTIVVGEPGSVGFGDAYIYELVAGNWTRVAIFFELGVGFGQSVAVDGNTVAVGVPRGDSTDGAVNIYKKGASWEFDRTLTALDGVVNDNFGYAVDVSGDLVIVGAPGALDLSASVPGSSTTEGAAYLYDLAQSAAVRLTHDEALSTGFDTGQVVDADDTILLGLDQKLRNGDKVRYTTFGTAIGGLENG